ncbi:hypothetical protein [Microbulbifer spongiae]|uniref:Uncharacterized protein n=1 Tax=Microbulbifer spongiae TaxID=2944933 RepID=A0ABY9E8A5_9GAMM|nr:hypothetical protein [Microbulbifer sp. MI-G]WKD48897.1 hypothetical protein M8T91_13470 [Microbulbifer sp. MI-G]
MSRKFFSLSLKLFALLLLVIIFVVALYKADKKNSKPDIVEDLPPVATVEYLNPTEEFPHGRLEKYHYRYGTLTIDRSFAAYGSLSEDGLFAEINVAWPGLKDAKHYFASTKDSRLRIIFEINRDSEHNFRDVYGANFKFLTPNVTRSHRYPGFVGYKVKDNKWLYIATDPKLVMPQGMPVAISCFITELKGRPIIHLNGNCRYNFLFDSDLVAQVRFSEFLMKDFFQVHKDLTTFLKSIMESN